MLICATARGGQKEWPFFHFLSITSGPFGTNVTNALTLLTRIFKNFNQVNQKLPRALRNSVELPALGQIISFLSLCFHEFDSTLQTTIGR